MTQAMRMLLAEGLITRDELEKALTLKAARGGSASRHLVDEGAIGSEELARFMARRFPLPRWQRQRLALVAPAILAAIPAALARSLRVLPVARRGEMLTVAIVDPTETHALEEAARAAGIAIEVVLVSEEDMGFALGHHYGREAPRALEPHDEIPLPLIRRVTRRMAVVQEGAPEGGGTTPGAGSIAEALDAIPLVQRVDAARPDYDSWSTGPAFSPAQGAAERTTARAMGEGEVIAAIGDAGDRDAVVALALGYLRRFASRAAFFTVRRGEIRGFDIVDEVSHRDAARSLWFPTSAPSTLSRVAEERQVYAGPLGKTAADAVLSAALGGRPERVIVLPIALKEKTVGLLMGDGFSADAPPRARLERLSDAVAEAFTRLISRGRD